MVTHLFGRVESRTLTHFDGQQDLKFRLEHHHPSNPNMLGCVDFNEIDAAGIAARARDIQCHPCVSGQVSCFCITLFAFITMRNR